MTVLKTGAFGFRKFTMFSSIILCLISCTHNSRVLPGPVKGLLDLRDWDFNSDGNVRLIGEWEFVFGDLLSPAQFDSLPLKQYIKVPGVWKRINGRATGYASYRLKVRLAQGNERIGLRVQDMGTAFKVFINDSVVAASGEVGTSEKTSKPQYLPQIVLLDQPGSIFDLTVWVSNFHYRKGGFWKEITLGGAEKIKNEDRNRLIWLLLTSGVWFMVCFTLLCFYLYRTKEKSILYLFLWAFSLFVRQITADDRMLAMLIPDLPFELLVRLELISGYFMAPFAIMSLSYLLPAQFSRRIANYILLTVLMFAIVVLISPALIYTYLVVPYQILSIAFLVYACQRIGIAIWKKQTGAAIIGIALVLVLIMYVIQILFYNNLIDFYFGSTSVMIGFIFAFAQIILLAKLFSTALKKVESFAIDLEKTVEIRTRELISAQEQLIAVAKHSENEKIRRRISQDIHDEISSGLNKISWMGELVKVKAQRNKTEEMNVALDKIIRSARETVDHLVEIIWSLNPGNDNLENLLIYMRNYLNKFFEDTPFMVHIDFPEQPDRIDLNPELKRNIYLVMKEAVHNAAKYSEADNISLLFKYDDKKFEFIISDDGIGIEKGIVKGTGNGMINMRKRMEEVGCGFHMESEPGMGTSIYIEGRLY